MSAGTLAVPRHPLPATRRQTPSAVSNARLAIAVVIAAESMLFTGLIGAYLVFRLAAPAWPPADLPRLPLGVTAVNTLILLASVVPITRALRAVRRDDRPGFVRGLEHTALAGALFLAVQGAEWTRLVGHGLTLASGPYGATFYVLIGCHGLHVLAAVAWLGVTAVLARRGAFSAASHGALEMCAVYWYFVCALWVVLFPLVYLY